MPRSNHVPDIHAERLTIIVLKALIAFWLKIVPLSTPRLMYKSESAARTSMHKSSFHVGLKPSRHAKQKLAALWITPTPTHGRL